MDARTPVKGAENIDAGTLSKAWNSRFAGTERGMQMERCDHKIADVSENELSDLAELFKVFGDSTRIKILFDLFHGEKNVTEICEDLEMNQSAISHQLKILRTSKLIGSRRQGKAMIYFLADDHVKTIIAMGKEHIEE